MFRMMRVFREGEDEGGAGAGVPAEGGAAPAPGPAEGDWAALPEWARTAYESERSERTRWHGEAKSAFEARDHAKREFDAFRQGKGEGQRPPPEPPPGFDGYDDDARKFGETAVERAKRLALEEARKEYAPLSPRLEALERAEQARAERAQREESAREQQQMDDLATSFRGTKEKPGKYPWSNPHEVVRNAIAELKEGLDKGRWSLDDVRRLLPATFERHAKESHTRQLADYDAWRETERAKEAAEARGKLGARKGGTGKNGIPAPEKGGKPPGRKERAALWNERVGAR